MYFKVNNNTETGKKFIALKNEMEKCQNETKKLIESVDFKKSDDCIEILHSDYKNRLAGSCEK